MGKMKPGMSVRISLLAACICLGMPCWAQDREESAAESAYNQAYQDWELGLTRSLAQHENPMVRVLGSWQLDTLSQRIPALKGEGRKVRASALEDGWSDPAVVLNVFNSECFRGRPEHHCDPSEIQAQLLRIDPDNAVAVLLPWLFPGKNPAEPLPLDAENVATLVKAAGKNTFDLHITAGLYDAYLAIERYESLHGKPEMSQQLLAELDERGIQVPAGPIWEPSSRLLISAFASNGYVAIWQLMDLCGLAESETYTRAINACLNIADLMQLHSKTHLEELMGYGLRKRVERPGYSGTDNERLDPERWRDQVRQLESACARPRMLPGFNSTQMPADHWSQYVRDLQESGELVASRRAAAREYAEFPESYAMDPAECLRIHELDKETQQRLATDHEIEQLGNVLRALDKNSSAN